VTKLCGCICGAIPDACVTECGASSVGSRAFSKSAPHPNTATFKIAREVYGAAFGRLLDVIADVLRRHARIVIVVRNVRFFVDFRSISRSHQILAANIEDTRQLAAKHRDNVYVRRRWVLDLDVCAGDLVRCVCSRRWYSILTPPLSFSLSCIRSSKDVQRARRFGIASPC
jgi:hypothetical protein